MTTHTPTDSDGSLFERVANLPVTIDGSDLDRTDRKLSTNFTRTTTIISLHGDGTTGSGEAITYGTDDQHALDEGAHDAPAPGRYTLASFSAALDETDRRWGFESAVLDLAFQQADTTLAATFDQEYEPIRFVVSPSLGDPPTANPIHTWLDIDPDLEFKINASTGWTPTLADDLVATDAIRIVDMKDQSNGRPGDEPPDPDLYRLVVEKFSDAIIEDPAITDATRPILADVRERLSWDWPITGVESIRTLPFEPSWVNIKPSLFGTVESLFDAIEYCLEHDIQMYGGGQFEQNVGRGQLHALASVFYPNGPNDIAPTGYNDPEPRADLPSSPLDPPVDPKGFGWD